MADLPGEDELRVMVSARPYAKGFMGRVHLMNMEGKAVGCGWNPDRHRSMSSAMSTT